MDEKISLKGRLKNDSKKLNWKCTLLKMTFYLPKNQMVAK
jgi:hypothetical protein